MNPVLQAVQKAKVHIEKMAIPDNKLEKELTKLTKKQLIEKVLELSPKVKPVKINEIVFTILEDPECAWLTWDTIAALITSYVPGSNTTADSLKWYPSDGTKKGKTIIPRKRTKEIAEVLTQSLTGDQS